MLQKLGNITAYELETVMELILLWGPRERCHTRVVSKNGNRACENGVLTGKSPWYPSSLRRSSIVCRRSHLHVSHHNLIRWVPQYRFAGTTIKCLRFGNPPCAVSATNGSNGLPVLRLSHSEPSAGALQAVNTRSTSLFQNHGLELENLQCALVPSRT